MELITILETIPEHPLSTEESRAESVTTLRGLPAVTRAELDRTLADPSPLLIDVWGPRCTACLLMAPVMTELHDRLGDEVRVMQVDGEADRELMAQLDTYALPTYLLFSGGERRGYFVGFRGVDAFERQIRAALLP